MMRFVVTTCSIQLTLHLVNANIAPTSINEVFCLLGDLVTIDFLIVPCIGGNPTCLSHCSLVSHCAVLLITHSAYVVHVRMG